MLQLILGRTGYGKTEYIKNLIKKFSKEKEVVFLVPDQLSFNMERDVVNLCPAHQAANVNVVTFSKLANEVIAKYGGVAEKRIDDNGRNLIMSLAINDCIDNLTMYATSAKAGRLTKLMLDISTELKACKIGADELFELSEKSEDKGLKNKLNEIALIYKSFVARLENAYIEPCDIITKAGKILRQDGGDFFKDKVMLIDSFEGFDTAKNVLLECALAQCDVYAAVCCDDIYADEIGSIFTQLMDTGRTLVSLANKVNAKVLPFVRLDKAMRFKSEELEFLEKYFFSSIKPDVKKESHDISIYKAPDAYKEVEYVAASIRNLVIDGYEYGDINVVCGDSTKYSSIIESIFKRYEIPVFVARPKMVDSKALVRLALNAINIAEFGFKTESLLNMAKTYLCGLNQVEISALEEYVYMWKIDSWQWTQPFTKSSGGFKEKADDKKLDLIENARVKLVKPISDFKEKLTNATCTQICTAIYELLSQFESDKHLLKHYKELEKAGLHEESEEQLRIWDELMATLSQFVGIIGDTEIDIKFFAKMFKDVLAKQEIMDIPLKLDCVMVSSASQIKNESKISFLMGCALEEFPKVLSADTVFTQYEKKLLEAEPFVRSIEQDILLERFYAYSSALSASEKLFVSFDSTKSPSEIINEIQMIFDIDIIEDLPNSFFANSYSSAFSMAAKLYRQNSSESASFKKLVSEDEVLKDKWFKLIKSIKKQDLSIKNPEISKKLFDKKYISPSQVDVYYRCKFRHFCQYGLNLKEKNTAEIDVLNYGSVMHYIFENILKEKYENENKIQFSDDDIKGKIKEYIKKFVDENMGGLESLDPSDQYRLYRLEKTALIITKRLIEEIDQSQFKPKFWELEISKDSSYSALEVNVDKYSQKQYVGINEYDYDGVNIEPDDQEQQDYQEKETDQKIYVGGKVDRVDIYQKDGEKYVRVIDYKTGKREFKINDILTGMSLQMLIYMAALKENKSEDLLPAGVLYVPSAYPEVSAKRDEKIEAIGKKRDLLMRMKGVVLQDLDIITAMEKEKQGKYIPSTGLSGENLLSDSEFDEVFEYIKYLIAKMKTEMDTGNVKAQPLMFNEKGCDYCQYSSICLLENEEECENFPSSKKDTFNVLRSKKI